VKSRTIVSLILVLFLAVAFSVYAGGTGEKQKTGTQAVGKQYTWSTGAGTFTLSERIAKKVAAGEQLVFVASTIDAASPYAKDVRRGIDQAVKDFPIKYRMIGPTDSVPEKQIAELETLIKAEQVDGIAIAVWDANTITPIFKLAWDKGIPATCFAVDSPQSPRLAYIGPSHVAIGKLGAEALMKAHPAKTGKLAIFAANPEGVYARGRTKGVLETLKANGYNMTVIGPVAMTLDTSKAYAVVENTFLANPDIEAVYSCDEYVQYAGEYVKRNNLQDKVVVIGVNDFPAILDLIKEKVIRHTTGQNAPAHGYMPAKIMYDFITTGKTVPEIPDFPLDEITSENVDAFIASHK
jgi:ABC-type sugar transport system substrate-binding protein